ncbi:hypothetical protein SEPCBS119000_001230 [Sporothrix epigloea]|uniref:Uncharacterized protein n=1 Tax=Sporothrix epigloea TaxID=1892477 RepID=A0ABP0DCR7_9PEZI
MGPRAPTSLLRDEASNISLNPELHYLPVSHPGLLKTSTATHNTNGKTGSNLKSYNANDNLDISGTRIPASDDNVPDQRYEPTLVNPGSCSDSAFEARRQAFPGPDSPRLDQGPQVKQANGVETDSRTHTIEVNYKPSHLHTASMKDSRHDNHTKNFLKDARHVFDDSDLYDGAGDDGNTNWFVDLQPVAQPEKKRGRPPGINVRIKTKKKKKKWSLEATLGVVDIDTCLAKVKFLSLTPPPIHTRDPPEQATTVRLEQSALWFTVHPCRAIRRKYLRFIDDPLANNKDLGNQLSSVMASSSRPLPPPL